MTDPTLQGGDDAAALDEWRRYCRRLEALALIGLGVRRLSITPASVGPIKELLTKVDTREIAEAMQGWLANPPANMRAELVAWASERGIDCD